MKPNLLPPDDALRLTLHNEVHARPSAEVGVPALITSVAVLNDGVGRELELQHLRSLTGQPHLQEPAIAGNFGRWPLVHGGTIKWERHTEFTRYSLVQPLPAESSIYNAAWATPQTELPADWLAGIPGRTICAVQLLMLIEDLSQAQLLEHIKRIHQGKSIVASRLGVNQNDLSHSWVFTSFEVEEDGFERMVLLMRPDRSSQRAGRVSQRLLEMESYRMMALRGLPVAKEVWPMLNAAERELADITTRMESRKTSDQALLDALVSLASRVESLIAAHGYRFSATRAYEDIMRQRIVEMRERPLSGLQTLGEFMGRRVSPAMATVAAAGDRLQSLSERVARASDLLRTRVDIATEAHNQALLAKLTRGQALQLKLQSTVEGLSIAAISYYVISLLLYAAKALKAGGWHVEPEIIAGLLLPAVVGLVWWTNKQIHARMHDSDV